MSPPSIGEILVLILVKILINPVVLLTVIVPTLFILLREHLQASHWTITKQNKGSPPDWLDYLLHPHLNPYMNFWTGFYSLCGAWLALLSVMAHYQFKAYLSPELLSQNLPIRMEDFRAGLWVLLVVFAVAFIWMVLFTRYFSRFEVLSHFYNYHPPIKFLERFPPLNRILLGRGVLLLVALMFLFIEISWFRI